MLAATPNAATEPDSLTATQPILEHATSVSQRPGVFSLSKHRRWAVAGSGPTGCGPTTRGDRSREGERLGRLAWARSAERLTVAAQRRGSLRWSRSRASVRPRGAVSARRSGSAAAARSTGNGARRSGVVVGPRHPTSDV
jgi:hypothetical protein